MLPWLAHFAKGQDYALYNDKKLSQLLRSTASTVTLLSLPLASGPHPYRAHDQEAIINRNRQANDHLTLHLPKPI